MLMVNSRDLHFDESLNVQYNATPPSDLIREWKPHAPIIGYCRAWTSKGRIGHILVTNVDKHLTGIKFLGIVPESGYEVTWFVDGTTMGKVLESFPKRERDAALQIA